jgi:DnaK suppressor protein
MSSALTVEQQTELRRAVEAERRRVAHQVAALGRDVDEIVTASTMVATDDEHDPEGSTIAYERAKASALLGSAARDLAALDEQRARINAGRAATCARCGGDIALERLLALPVTAVCVTCAELG